jgi:hypothetical protein
VPAALVLIEAGRSEEADRIAVNLENMLMAMTVLHLQQGRVRASVAAMPPFSVFRAATGKVETIPAGGMFLGSCISLPYEEVSFHLSPNDVILLMTDGLVELHGPDSDTVEDGGQLPLGIVIEVAGRKMQADFEPVLERQVREALPERRREMQQGLRLLQ